MQSIFDLFFPSRFQNGVRFQIAIKIPPVAGEALLRRTSVNAKQQSGLCDPIADSARLFA
jgi:hypothetical protein